MVSIAVRCVLMLMLFGSAGAAGQTVYRTVAPDGAVTFSDRPGPDAVAIDLPSIDVSEARIDAARAAVEDMLKVAGLLEASRLRREQLRSERALVREALWLEADRVRLAEIERPRYGFVPVVGLRHHRGFGHRPRSPQPPETNEFQPSVYAPKPFKPPVFHQ